MCGGELRGDGSAEITAISKDTRAIRPGDLYIGIRGERFDGGAFAHEAAARGAAGAIIERSQASSTPPGFPVIAVEDALAALSRLAAAWRDRLTLRALCITGSNGKTSTKEFVASVLSERYRVTKTEGNLNNHIGLPLSILAARGQDQIAVWEIGMNHPGEIAPLARLARPDIGIITNIGVAHIEFLGSREAIAREKGMLAEAVHEGGSVILSGDDPSTPAIRARTRARVVLAGGSAGSVTASNIRHGESGVEFLLSAGTEALSVRLQTHGEHMVRNATLAAAAGLEAGLSLEECAVGLARAKMVGGRLQTRIIRGIRVLDDTYNASPDSMEAALDTLRKLPTSGRRVAAIGRMGELGDYAAEGYARVGRAAAGACDLLLGVGADVAPCLDAARDQGLPVILSAETSEEGGRQLRGLLSEGDTLLVKGSRSARMENLIKAFEN